MLACIGRNSSPLFKLINHNIVVLDEVYILFHFNVIMYFFLFYCCNFVFFYVSYICRVWSWRFIVALSVSAHLRTGWACLYVCRFSRPCAKLHALNTNFSSLLLWRLSSRSIQNRFHYFVVSLHYEYYYGLEVPRLNQLGRQVCTSGVLWSPLKIHSV